ncbi:MAG: hypothetical protein JRI68_14900 [Deltaproteobacteria bacterium]|nr:hypothetical protein [Deltaproteobacteria bacterium]
MHQSWCSLGAFLVFTAAVGVGCDDAGDGGSGGTGTGAGTATGGSGGTGGAGGSGTAGSGGTNPTNCTYDGFDVVEDHVRDGTPVVSFYLAEGDADAPMDLLVIQSWHDGGAPVGAYEHTFTNENYSDCATCTLIARGCPNPTGTDDTIQYNLPACDQVFMVITGQLAIQGAGAAYAGTLTDAHAVEVTIDWEGDFTSTPVVDGDTWCVPNLTFPM